ncbi:MULTISPECIES: DUF2089 domain-containing protein [Dehalococcoides]|jgi:hypothetical protein|uniref:DUF2089 domain-containing protein n=1 Tax=Dehalococcoides mccartyi (strain VS) TaxID=311424 RepID=D2BH81_DEHMV|nr:MULTISPECIES: DUF2089 domain-containing protein [Dehalococcoides]ACZ61681.1 hypothetical protein DhcVS_528 [Dehalococcoides mccartyi VS]AHB13299.1 hypothetical protein GY50_0516 [Dehalococcoides mccartyi GY50]QYY58196.1 DUF2089 domain-containing protein [Dehalococcoides mccartyi]BAQ34471.1 hypothetical protein UCH007_05130 [Dehalococcoides sp. UCH007]
MAKDWQELTKLTQGTAVTVERVKLVSSGIAIEGSFDLPALARLSAEDQVFVMAFVKCHGSIKDMEKFFGISYPTVKNRLQRIGANFSFVENFPTPPKTNEDDNILTELEKGGISVEEALRRLQR